MGTNEEEARVKTEKEARVLRDKIYGPSKDPNNWAYCKDNWIRDIEWLRKMANTRSSL